MLTRTACSWFVFLSAVVVCYGFTGCHSPRSQTQQSIGEGNGSVPRVLSIGSESALTFQDGLPLEIPIDVFVSRESVGHIAQISVTVTATAPGVRGRDYWLDGSRISSTVPPSKKPSFERSGDDASALLVSSIQTGMYDEEAGVQHVIDSKRPLYVVLDASYVNRFYSNDRITIRVDYNTYVNQPDANGSDTKAQLTATNKEIAETNKIAKRKGSVSRTFTLIEASDFRAETLADQLPIHQIAAFPLPDEEAEALFGHKIAKRFFVVRMAIRNDSDKPILVSTGMVQASGRALVNPGDGTRRFSMPVTVTPQSWEAVFAVLERDEVNDQRSKILRGMKFVGALATAWANAASWGVDAITGLGVYTGVFIPESEKLSPDPFIGYKRNIVNFSMQEHTKVPQNSVSKSKFVYFSKDSVRALILDTNLHPDLGMTTKGLLGGSKNTAESAVVYIEINNLAIPFDKIENQESKELIDAATLLRDKTLILEVLTSMRLQLDQAIARRMEATLLVAAISEDIDIRTSATRIIERSRGSVQAIESLYRDAEMATRVATATGFAQRIPVHLVEIETMFAKIEAMREVAHSADLHISQIPERWDEYSAWRRELLGNIEGAASASEVNQCLKQMHEFLRTLTESDEEIQ